MVIPIKCSGLSYLIEVQTYITQDYQKSIISKCCSKICHYQGKKTCSNRCHIAWNYSSTFGFCQKLVQSEYPGLHYALGFHVQNSTL